MNDYPVDDREAANVHIDAILNRGNFASLTTYFGRMVVRELVLVPALEVAT